MANPVIAELTRGGIVESVHRGAFVVLDEAGKSVITAGDITRPIFPRSAIKAMQCTAMMETGAASAFNLDDQEIALCCASHHGQDIHVKAARSILAKCGCEEGDLECGAHMPTNHQSRDALIKSGNPPLAVHNNCSGKHAGMLAMATHLGVAHKNYILPDHPVQQGIARTMAHMCAVDLSQAPMGIDGCSVPTWALPLQNIARGFVALAKPENTTGQRIITSVRAHPIMIAGTKNFDSEIMKSVPRLFIKYGAEGVYCGAIAHAGLGFAMKCDDGAPRAVEVAIAGILAQLDCWTENEREILHKAASETMSNWRKKEVGERRAAALA
jgi:L-asparaginase II